jgi:hypothetical protein
MANVRRLSWLAGVTGASVVLVIEGMNLVEYGVTAILGPFANTCSALFLMALFGAAERSLAALRGSSRYIRIKRAPRFAPGSFGASTESVGGIRAGEPFQRAFWEA